MASALSLALFLRCKHRLHMASQFLHQSNLIFFNDQHQHLNSRCLQWKNVFASNDIIAFVNDNMALVCQTIQTRTASSWVSTLEEFLIAPNIFSNRKQCGMHVFSTLPIMAVFLVNLFVASELPRHFPIEVCANFCLAKLLSQGWSDVQLPFAPGGICEDVLSTWLLKTVADTKTFKDAKFAKRILGHDGGQHVVMTWREHMQQQLSISQIECECVIEHQICIKQLCSNTCIQATEGQHNNIKQHICNWKWTHCPDTVSDEHTHTHTHLIDCEGIHNCWKSNVEGVEVFADNNVKQVAAFRIL